MGTLGKIIFELFENTHKWARSDAINEPLPWGIRGIRCELHRDWLRRFQADAAESAVVASYFNHPRFTTAPRDYIRVLEVSVFDSGPGIAARSPQGATVATGSIDSEYQALRERFALHRTSSSATHRGKGLDQVMRLLSEHSGFLRLRSGRLNMQRDFIAHPYQLARQSPHSGTPSEPFFLDWSGNLEPVAHALATGVLFSFFFPVIDLGSPRNG
jgi:hypothetical protein